MHIVILPGLDGTGKLVGSFAGLLTGYHVTALSYPPHIADHADLANWIEEQLPDEPFALIAESYSGPAAALLAARKPHGLKAVVFVATFAKSPRFIPRIALQIGRRLPLTSPRFLKLIQSLVMGRWASPDFTQRFVEAVSHVASDVLVDRLAAIRQVNAALALRALPVPSLYLQARHDRLVPSRAARPFAYVKRINGPHFLLQANPDDAATEVRAFLDRVTDRTGP